MTPNNKNEAPLFFITGSMRSGTTLLDKVMHNHPQAACLSQPAPSLYLSTKKAFFHSFDIDEQYEILSSYFLESRYRPEDFTNFLQGFQFTAAQLDEINEGMVSFREKNPTYSRAESLKLADNNDLIAIYKQLVTGVAADMPEAMAFGSKEVIDEEYLPYFMDKGVKCLLIVRDPRDALTSTYYGKGSSYTGAYKPFLLMMRNWRKSVAFALEHKDNANIYVMRYEDLVREPSRVIDDICRFIGIPKMDIGHSLNSQNGGQWAGNSSYEDVVGISTKSIGRYKEHMQPEVQRYIQSVCFPEMSALGYDNPLTEPDEALIRSFETPEPIASMDKKMTAAERGAEAKNELERLSLLQSAGCTPAEQERYFIYPGVYQKLKTASKAMV